MWSENNLEGSLLSSLVNPGLECGSSGWALPAEHLSVCLYVLYILYAFGGRGLDRYFTQFAPELAVLHPQLPSADHTWLPPLFVIVGDLGMAGGRCLVNSTLGCAWTVNESWTKLMGGCLSRGWPEATMVAGGVTPSHCPQVGPQLATGQGSGSNGPEHDGFHSLWSLSH